MAVETSGLAMTQAMASCACEHPSSVASSLNLCSPAIVLAFFSSEKQRLKILSKSGFLSYLVPSGIPSLYLPVSTPPASGDQIVVPSSFFSKSFLQWSSILSLLQMLYWGCSTTGLTRPYLVQTQWAQAISSEFHSLVPQQKVSPLRMSQSNALQIYSMGVSGSGRWQNTTSTQSQLSLWREPLSPSMMCLRESPRVLGIFADFPQNNLVDSTK